MTNDARTTIEPDRPRIAVMLTNSDDARITVNADGRAILSMSADAAESALPRLLSSLNSLKRTGGRP